MTLMWSPGWKPPPHSDVRGSIRSATNGGTSLGQSASVGRWMVADRTTGGGHTPREFAVMIRQGTPAASCGLLPVGGPRKAPVEVFAAEGCGCMVAAAALVTAAMITSA